MYDDSKTGLAYTIMTAKTNAELLVLSHAEIAAIRNSNSNYLICFNDSTGLYEIQKNDEQSIFDTDLQAGEQAQKDGVPVILFDDIYCINTPYHSILVERICGVIEGE